MRYYWRKCMFEDPFAKFNEAFNKVKENSEAAKSAQAATKIQNEQALKQRRMSELQAANKKKREEQKAKEADRIDQLKREYYAKKPDSEPKVESQVVSMEEAKADAQRAKKQSQLSMYRELLEDPETTEEDSKLYKSQIKKLEKELGVTGTPNKTETVIKPNKAENYVPENTQVDDQRSTLYKGKLPGIVGNDVTAEAPAEPAKAQSLQEKLDDYHRRVISKDALADKENEQLKRADAAILENSGFNALKKASQDYTTIAEKLKNAHTEKVENSKKNMKDVHDAKLFRSDRESDSDMDYFISNLLKQTKVDSSIKDKNGNNIKLYKDETQASGIVPKVSKYTYKNSSGNTVTKYYFSGEDPKKGTATEQEYNDYKNGTSVVSHDDGTTFKSGIAKAIDQRAFDRALNDIMSNSDLDGESIELIKKRLPKSIQNAVSSPVNFDAEFADDLDTVISSVWDNNDNNSPAKNFFYKQFKKSYDKMIDSLTEAAQKELEVQSGKDLREKQQVVNKGMDARLDDAIKEGAAKNRGDDSPKLILPTNGDVKGYNALIKSKSGPWLGKIDTYEDKNGNKQDVVSFYPAFKDKHVSNSIKTPDGDIVQRYTTEEDNEINQYQAHTNEDPLMFPFGADTDSPTLQDAIRKAMYNIGSRMGRAESDLRNRAAAKKAKKAENSMIAQGLLDMYGIDPENMSYYNPHAAGGWDRLMKDKGFKDEEQALKNLAKIGLGVNKDDRSLRWLEDFTEGNELAGKSLLDMIKNNKRAVQRQWFNELPINTEKYSTVKDQMDLIDSMINKLNSKEDVLSVPVDERHKKIDSLEDVKTDLLRKYISSLTDDELTTYKSSPETEAKRALKAALASTKRGGVSWSDKVKDSWVKAARKQVIDRIGEDAYNELLKDYTTVHISNPYTDTISELVGDNIAQTVVAPETDSNVKLAEKLDALKSLVADPEKAKAIPADLLDKLVSIVGQGQTPGK